MALPNSELNGLKTRCQKAVAAGFGVGKADAYMADLCSELGRKPNSPATPETLLEAILEVEAVRAGKSIKTLIKAPEPALMKTPAPASPPAPVAPEGEDEDDDSGEEKDEDEGEDVKSSPVTAPRAKSSKKKKAKKR